jgi:hypothetical protein
MAECDQLNGQQRALRSQLGRERARRAAQERVLDAFAELVERGEIELGGTGRVGSLRPALEALGDDQ